MKIPLSWLKEFIPSLVKSPEEIADILTSAGIEVENIEHIGASFDKVFVAHVREVAPHPQADRLVVAQVFDGTETIQVVCGDPECRPGLLVALAKAGATLKDAEGNPWKIKKGKLRGIESNGMLCSWDELHLPGPTEGIAHLPANWALGQDISTLYSDVVFNVSLTPNLGHCLSIYGIARELSSFLSLPLLPLEASLPNLSPLEENPVALHVNNVVGCPRYLGRLVQEVQVKPSPQWLQDKLSLLGMRPINNVVDISNYVMLLTGQPLHFFDYDKLSSKEITVASCKTSISLKTLDGVERVVPAETLLIQDGKEILAIAGIMGTEQAEIAEGTKNVFIEAAEFSPSSIRKTARALGLKTEASSRFEKGIDLSRIPMALDLATKLLVEEAGGKRFSKKVEHYPTARQTRKIPCRRARVNSLLGLHLSLREISDLLNKLYLRTVEESQDSLVIEVPLYRNDIQQEIDLIEEVARIYGFTEIAYKEARHVSSPLPHDPLFEAENKTRAHLLCEGLQEFLTCDLLSPALSELGNPKVEAISVLQSKSNDYSVLRTSLLPGLLQLVKYNVDHQNFSILGFEVGRIHFKQENRLEERSHIGIVLSGERTPYHYLPKLREVDFFDLKGMVENLLNRWRLPGISFLPSHLSLFQPGKQATIQAGDIVLGALGEVHPEARRKLGLDQRVFFAELDLDELIRLAPTTFSFQELPQMPSSERDWTLTLSKQVPVEEVLSHIRNSASPLLEKAFLLDVFESDKLGTDRKNVTFRFVYRGIQTTLDFETVEQEHANLIQKVAKNLASCIMS